MRAASVRVRWDQDNVATAASADPVDAVRAVLAVDDAELDYGRAKLAFDQLVDPSLAVPDTMARLDRLADVARPHPRPPARTAPPAAAARGPPRASPPHPTGSRARTRPCR